MAYIKDFWKDQWYNIMFFVVIMLSLIALFSILGINFKEDNNKELKGYEIDKLLLDENLPNEWPLLILIY